MPTAEMTPNEAARNLDGLRCIDVRERHEFDGPLGYIDGAELYPLGTLPGALRNGNRNDRLLVICRSGKRSLEACKRLEAQGFKQIANLSGGMIAWNLAGFQVHRSDIRSLEDLLKSLETYVAQVTPCERSAATELLSRLLSGAGASYEAPTAPAISEVLHELSEQLQNDRWLPAPPPDLRLALNAYHRDLAVL